MKDENFILIQGWMINNLELSSVTELNAFALIYGFSQDDESEFTGSINYLCNFLKCSRPTVIKTLKSLVEKGYINKKTIVTNNVTFNTYKYSLLGVKKFNGGSKNSLQGGSKNSLPNNTINNNTINIYREKQNASSLFPEKKSNDKELDVDSLPENVSEIFLKKMEKEISLGIDVGFYIESVLGWLTSLPKRDKRRKKTMKGYVATMQGFMRNDKAKGKLQMIKEVDEQEIERQRMIKYLNR